MALTTTAAANVTNLYVAMFGRAPDAIGLDYWGQRLDKGESLASVADAMFSVQPARAYYPAGASKSEIVTQFYVNVLGRQPDADGLAYWTAKMTAAGATPGKVISEMIGVVTNYNGTNPAGVESAKLFANKVTVADFWAKNNGGIDGADAPIKMVTADAASVNAVKVDIISGGGGLLPSNGMFTLTEVPPEIAKTFLWKNVDVSALRTMIGYANEVNNRGGNDVTSIADGDDDSNDHDGDGYFFDTSFIKFIENIVTEYEYEELVDEQIIWNPAILTTAGTTRGVVELGNTTNADNLIVAGTSYALHGAYIDGGGGRNTLEVEMKGPFAQPKQLINIQEVQVHNVTNYYDPSLFGYNNSGRTDTGDFDIVDYLDVSGYESILDLTSARQLQKLVVTESEAEGRLAVLGIRNYADTKLEGGFDQDVYLHYTTGQKAVLNLELVNVDFGSSDNSGALVVAHNAGHVAINSQGFSNVLNDVYFGNSFQKLTVTGSGRLLINESLEFAANAVEIDASANTGGVYLDLEVQDYAGEFEEVLIKGSAGRDQIKIQDTAAGVLLNIDMGAGRNTLDLAEVDAGRGSVITGENLTLRVVGKDGGADGVIQNPQNDTPTATTNLSFANIAGVDAFVLDKATSGTTIPTLRITAAQFSAAGAAAFSALHRDTSVELLINITSDTTLSSLASLSQLSSAIKLNFVVSAGATLTLTAEELHKYVAVDGIYLDDDATTSNEGVPASHGKVVITNAGLNFDWASSAQAADGETSYNTGGTIKNTWTQAGENITVVRATDGYDRPAAADLSDSLTIDSTAGAVTVGPNLLGPDTEFTLAVKKLVLKGSNDITFTAVTTFEAGDGTDINNFSVDASGLTGTLNGLTINNFEDITNGADKTLWGTIKGTAGNDRINVQLSGDVGDITDVAKGGVRSTGVETFVVTKLDADRNFAVCDTTVGVTTLGLQGNVGKEITFHNVKFGTSFLMEGDGKADWTALPKQIGNPNSSNIGTLNAEYFLFDANMAANVTINNRGVALGVQTDGTTPRAFAVDGVNISNVDTINVTIQDGDAVISEITGVASAGADELDNISITSANDVTLTLGVSNTELESFDASGVAGDMTVVIPTSTTLDLGGTDIEGIDAVVMGNLSELTLPMAAFNDIGAANISVDDPDTDAAIINLNGLDETPFTVADLNEGVSLGTLIVAEQVDGVVTLAATTDLTGASEIVVPEGMTLNLTGAQFRQLTGDGVISGDGTVNITGITQADVDAGLDLSDITAVAGTLTFVGNVVLKATTDIGSATINVDADGDGDVDLSEANYIPEGMDFVSNVGFSINLADGQQLTMATVDQAHNRVVDGGANTKVIFTFTDEGSAEIDFNDGDAEVSGVNLAYYTNLTTLQVRPSLVADENVEQILGNLDEDTVVVIDEPVVPGDNADPTFRNVVITAGTEVNGDLIFENLNVEDPDFLKLTDVSLTLQGGVVITGDIDVSGAPLLDQGFETLTIISEGDEVNEIGDDVQASLNNLLDVRIEADQELIIGGDIEFSTQDEELDSASLLITGTADVTIEQLDIDNDGEFIAELTITNNGTGTLTVTGSSPALDTADGQTVRLAGSGDMVFGTVTTDPETEEVTDIDGLFVRSGPIAIDASDASGDIDFGTLISIGDITFTSGSGITSLVIGGDDVGEDGEPSYSALGEDIGQVWSFDLSDAAAGSTLTIDVDTVEFYDNAGKGVFTLGEGVTLVINGDQTFSDLDGLTVTGGTMQIQGHVDFSNISDDDGADTDEIGLVLTSVDIELDAGAAVRMTDAQYAAFAAAGGTITGAGTTYVVDADTDDLDGFGNDVANVSDFRGITSLQIDGTLEDDLVMTAEQALVSREVEIDAEGVVSNATWDDDSNAATAEVVRAVQDLRGLDPAMDISILVTQDVDLSGLQRADVPVGNDLAGDDTIEVPYDTDAEDQHDIDLTVTDLMLDNVIDGDGSSAAADVLAQLSSLSVDVEVDTGLTDLAGDPVIETSTIEATYDAAEDLWNAVGNNAAIGEADNIGGYLAEMASITWTAVGNTAGTVLNNGGVADLEAVADVKDIFRFVAAPDDSGDLVIGGLDVSAVEADRDVLDFNAFLTAGATIQNATNVGFLLPVSDAALADETTAIGLDNEFLLGEVADLTDVDTVAELVSALEDTGLLDAVDIAIGDRAVLMLAEDGGTGAVVYYINNASGAGVLASEVTLVGTFTGTSVDLLDNMSTNNLVLV